MLALILLYTAIGVLTACYRITWNEYALFDYIDDRDLWQRWWCLPVLCLMFVWIASLWPAYFLLWGISMLQGDDKGDKT